MNKLTEAERYVIKQALDGWSSARSLLWGHPEFYPLYQWGCRETYLFKIFGEFKIMAMD